jgi:hypothetical protein
VSHDDGQQSPSTATAVPTLTAACRTIRSPSSEALRRGRTAAQGRWRTTKSWIDRRAFPAARVGFGAKPDELGGVDVGCQIERRYLLLRARHAAGDRLAQTGRLDRLVGFRTRGQRGGRQRRGDGGAAEDRGHIPLGHAPAGAAAGHGAQVERRLAGHAAGKG